MAKFMWPYAIASSVSLALLGGGMRKLWGPILACFALAGCSTSPTSASDARRVPAEFVYAAQTAQGGGATLTVIRDSGFVGGGCRFGLFVDGERVADLDPKEMVTVDIKPGQRVLGAGPAANARGLCSFNGPSMMREREANFDAGQQRYFRMSTSNGGDLDLSPVTRP